jgi:ribose transport system substrate-binding protein
LGFVGVACDAPAAPGAKDASRAAAGTLGITLMKYDNPFFVVLLDAARKAAKERGYELVENDAQEDSARQLEAVENFFTKGVRAILLNPVDSRAIVKAVEAANQRGVPVVCVDVKADGGRLATFVASDNTKLGVLTGEYIAARLGGKGGRIALVTYPEVSSGADRARGLKSVLEKHPGIAIVAEQPSRGDRLRAETAAANILTANPDLDCIWAINDPSALGCVSAVRRAGRDQRVFVVGIDGAPEAVKEITAGGPFAATAAQYPRQIGGAGVDLAIRAIAGEQLPEFVPIDGSLITKENVASYAGW